MTRRLFDNTDEATNGVALGYRIAIAIAAAAIVLALLWLT